MKPILVAINDSQAKLVSELRAEIERLKGVDAALKDFNFEIEKAELKALAEEGFADVVASRPHVRRQI
jgi:hypothetical protein